MSASNGCGDVGGGGGGIEPRQWRGLYNEPDDAKRYTVNSHRLSVTETADEMADDGRTNSRKSWKAVWQDFSRNTTIHGVNHITEHTPFTIRRLIWVIIVLAGMTLFGYQVVDRILYYYSWPINVDVRINQNHTVRYPAVTICNQNTFRISQAARYGMYNWLNAMYTHDDVSAFNYTHWRVGDVLTGDVYNLTAHRKNDLVVSCLWKGIPCSPESFQETVTDHGVCYTFNGRDYGEPLTISNTGAKGGLRLLLNLENYEYMRGPHDAGGLKILLHDQSEIPFVRDLGQAIPFGSHAFVGVDLVGLTNLPPPHGRCVNSKPLDYFDYYSKSACQVDCLTRFVVKQCGCRDIYMPSINNDSFIPTCDIANYTRCLLPALDAFENSKELCSCPALCTHTHYRGSITYASASSIDSGAETKRRYADLLGERYLATRETVQRVTASIRAEDEADIARLSHLGDRMERIIAKTSQHVADFVEFATRATRELTPRLKFHFDRGLYSLMYIMEHDFVRGWDVMDERTFAHVTTGFYQTTRLFRELVSAYNGSDENSLIAFSTSDSADVLKTSWYTNMAKDLMMRRYLARRARDNLTEVHVAFSTGVPILTYAATMDRRYDMSFICVDFLRHDRRETSYARTLKSYIDSFYNYTVTLENLNQDLYFTNRVRKPEVYEKAIKGYENFARKYNYYKFLYSNRIVKGAPLAVQARIDYYEKAHATYTMAIHELELTTQRIQNHVQNFQKSWRNISYVINEIAVEYINNGTVSKLELANAITSERITEDVQKFRTLFKDLRTLGQQLGRLWDRYSASHTKLWRSMLEESALNAFYKMIHDDVQGILYNETSRDYLAKVIADMVRTNASHILSRTPEQLMVLTNGDFAQIDRTMFYQNISAEFAEVRRKHDIVALIGEEADEFTNAIEEMQRKLHAYRQKTVIDDQFFRDNFMRIDVYMRALHYEEIVQQKDYGFIPLLSDIGGSMGLFIGASVLTVFEIIDVIVHNACLKYPRSKR